MKVSDFTQLLEYPGRLSTPLQIHQLDEVLAAYPWFQAARAMHLKGLKNLNSYKYNQALKLTAALTTDREVLFDFITSEVFNQNEIADAISGKASLKQMEVITEEVFPDSEQSATVLEPTEEGALPQSSKDADKILNPHLFAAADPNIALQLKEEAAAQKAKEELKLGQPLSFKKDERHSFSQWLQLTRLQTLDEPTPEMANSKSESNALENVDREKKFELIDRFIATNPKIIPNRDSEESPKRVQTAPELDKKELMTETLARIYLEQGKFKKALQAYRILILKYPEKSSFFADQIKAVEKLQDVKNKKSP
ncbi:MAG: hypothetical protein RLZZ241_2204 [Bacteroidota bacterium]|jgi:tetratricopeptide (TPR) repeat protein